jgi:hypothetical protein
VLKKGIIEHLKEIIGNTDEETINIGQLKEKMQSASYALLMLVFCLPLLIPIPTPGLSAIVSIPLVFLTFQLMIGKESPWFPKKISNISLKISDIKKVTEKLEPSIKKLEKFLKPRLEILLNKKAQNFIGAFCFFLSTLIILPIPFGNVIPAIAIFIISLGLLQKDGVFVIVGILFGIISVSSVLFFAKTIIFKIFS